MIYPYRYTPATAMWLVLSTCSYFYMPFITRKILLSTLTKHETLTIDDICKSENLGFVPDKKQLTYLLHQLMIRKQILLLPGVTPFTYTITTEGIKESERLSLTSGQL